MDEKGERSLKSQSTRSFCNSDMVNKEFSNVAKRQGFKPKGILLR